MKRGRYSEMKRDFCLDMGFTLPIKDGMRKLAEKLLGKPAQQTVIDLVNA